MGPHSPSSKQPSVVLVVDDDNEFRELIRVELELEGFTVLTSATGAEGIETARRARPDVILMDVLMPVMNGIEATRMLKNQHDTRHIPVLMVTVVERKDDIIKGLEAGAIDYITKPFFLPELQARVKTVLRFKRIHDELQSIQEHLIKKEMLNKIKEITWIIEESIDDNLAAILAHTERLRKRTEYVSEDELLKIRDAANNIKNTVANLGFLEAFTFKVYNNITNIVESDVFN
jgi:CheY-like chemotaxis protein